MTNPNLILCFSENQHVRGCGCVGWAEADPERDDDIPLAGYLRRRIGAGLHL